MENIQESQPPIYPTPQPQNNLLILIAGLLVFIFGGIAGFYLAGHKELLSAFSFGTKSVACTLEVKTCPDGSSVGRTGPNCEFATCPTPTDPTANWEAIMIQTEPILGLTDYQIKLPQGWWRIEHSSNFQNTEVFQDTHTPSFTYKLIIKEEKNINEKSGLSYTNLQTTTGFSYEVPTLSVAGESAIQVLPRAGSEMDYKILFFSPDTKFIISIELDTPRNGSYTEEGKRLFDQILSTFKFL